MSLENSVTPSTEPTESSLSQTLERMSLHPLNTSSAETISVDTTQTALASTASSPSPQKKRSSTPNTPPRPDAGYIRRQSSRSPQLVRKREPAQTPSKRATSSCTSARSSPAPSAAATVDAQNYVPATAASIAADFFKKELADQGKPDGPESSSDTVVIIHDACYGHRFSRPKTTKTNLSLIVERPERVQAVVRGISSAYVRLGGRYGEGLTKPPASIPFRVRRSTRLVPITSSVVTNVHGSKWMEELRTMCGAAGERLASGKSEMTRIEDASSAVQKPQLHAGDLYLSPESELAFQGALGGVFDAVDQLFEPEVEGQAAARKAFVCVRPPGHHCSADLPSGFCWINQVQCGIEHAVQAHGLTHAAIIDFDLHHGDGSQSITWERNTRSWQMPKNASILRKTAIGYFSLHDINSYPCEEGDAQKTQAASLCIENAHGQTVWNVHLQPWKTETDFWELYKTRYVVLLDKTREFLRAHTQRVRSAPGNVQPKAAVFISAGFDASEYEGEGMQRHKVNVPTEFYSKFTADIVRLAEEEGLSTDGRVISVLEGGYSDRALSSGTLSHLVGLVGTNESVSKASHHMRRSSFGTPESVYPTGWWNTLAMTELEALVSKSQGQPKRSRASDAITHATPTVSFLAKVVDPAKLWKGPPPPPPIVDWATAAFELSKQLIPSDRPVNSYRAEDLSEPRVKKERISTVVPSAEQSNDRQLRHRFKEVPVPTTTASVPPRTSRASRKSTEGTTVRTPRTSLSSANVNPTIASTTPTQPPKVVLPQTALPASNVNGSATRSREGSADVDQLTAGVRKITLKLSEKDKKELSANGPARQATQAKAPIKKAAATKVAKTITPKGSDATIRRAARSTPATPLLSVASSTTLDTVPAGLLAARALSEEAQDLAARDTFLAGAGAQQVVAPQEHEHDYMQPVIPGLMFAAKSGNSQMPVGSSFEDSSAAQDQADPLTLNNQMMTEHSRRVSPAPQAPSSALSVSSSGALSPMVDVINRAGAAPMPAVNGGLPTTAQPLLPKSNAQSTQRAPVFTSHGHIPFGTASTNEAPAAQKDHGTNNDIWAVPDTPGK